LTENGAAPHVDRAFPTLAAALPRTRSRAGGAFAGIKRITVKTAYGPNYHRLQQVKAPYDPENFFRMNQNIPARS
jgi:hypothetical protein